MPSEQKSGLPPFYSNHEMVDDILWEAAAIEVTPRRKPKDYSILAAVAKFLERVLIERMTSPKEECEDVTNGSM